MCIRDSGNRYEDIVASTAAEKQRYPHTRASFEEYVLNIEKVTDLLNTIDKSTQEYLALLLIHGELEIIHFYIDFSTYMLKKLRQHEIPTQPLYQNYNKRVANYLLVNQPSL